MSQWPRMADELLSAFDELEGELPGGEIGWIRALRRRAIASLADEVWRATDWADDEFGGLSLETAAFRPAVSGARAWLDPEELDPALTRAIRASSLVFVDGMLSKALTAPLAPMDEADVGSLREALQFASEDLQTYLGRQLAQPELPFVPLNTAFMSDGAVLRVRAGSTIPDPIRLLFVSSGPAGALATHPRVLLILEPESRATVVQTFIGVDGGVYLTNAVSEMVLGQGASLDFVLVQNESSAAFHLWTGAARLADGANLSTRAFLAGGAVSRHEQLTVLEGPEAHASHQAFVHVGTDAHASYASRIAHEGRGTRGEQKLLAWVDDGATATLRPAATCTGAEARVELDATAVLASDAASIRFVPELAAGGGTCRTRESVTVQPLDAASLRPLEAGGLTVRQARARLALALAEEIAGGLASRALAADVLQTLEEALARFRRWEPTV